MANYANYASNIASIFGGLNSSNAAGSAAAAGVAGVNNGINSVNTLYNSSTATNNPYITAGGSAAGTIANNIAPATSSLGGAVSGLQNTASGNNLNVSQFYDPSMAFTLQQGQQALQRSQAATGGVLSGAALKNLDSYSQGIASQNYQSAVTNALAEQSQQTSANTNLESGALTANSQLTPILNAGTSALGYQNSTASNAGSQLAQLNSNAGQLQAQGITQSAGGINTAIGGLLGAGAKAVGSANGTTPTTPTTTPTGYTSTGSSYSAPSNVSFTNYGGSSGGGYDFGSSLSDIFSDEATKTNIQAITPFSAAMTPQNAGLEGPAAGNTATVAPVSAIQPQTASSSNSNSNSNSGSSGGGGILGSLGGIIGGALSFFSDENTKKDISSLTDSEVEKSMEGMHPKTYEYNQATQAKGAPSGQQVGIIAQDVQKTPARDMVNDNNGGDKTVDVKKATSFLLAGYANLNKRLAQLEPEKKPTETKVKKGSK